MKRLSILLAVAAVVAGGCVTVDAPPPLVTVLQDPDALIAQVQASLDQAESWIALYQLLRAQAPPTSNPLPYMVELDKWAAKADELRAYLQRLIDAREAAQAAAAQK